METKMFYDAPRSISIGDIFYVIDTRERNDFSSPCQNCMLPVSKCKGDCTRKQILKNAANADKTEVKNGKHKAP